MKIQKIATNYNQVPAVGTRNWMTPRNAFLLRHVYWLDADSPLRKDYIIRVLAVPLDDRPGQSAFIVIAHYGGSANGNQDRQNQIKYSTVQATSNGNAGGPMQNINSVVSRLNGERTSKGYARISDTSWSLDHGVLATSIPLITRDASSFRGNPTQPTNPTAPRTVSDAIRDAAEALRRQQNRNTPPPPSPAPSPQVTLEERMRKAYLENDSTLASLVKDFPNWNEPTRAAVVEDVQNKILFGAQMSKAVMSDTLFPEIMKYPKELLNTISLSPEADHKIRSFREEMEMFPKFRLIRKMD